MPLRSALFPVVALLFAFCALQTAAQAAEDTAGSADTMQLNMNIPYSTEADGIRKIDVFLPKGNPNGCCIFFVHGGGWSGGNKESWHAVMKHFCAKGFVCTSAEYHLSPEWHYPKHVEGVRLAMSFVKSKAGEYGFDPKKIAVFGSSAGAHLAAMLATIQADDELGMSDEVTVRDTLPQAAVALCGVFDDALYDGKHKEMFERFLGVTRDEKPELYREALPLYRVVGKEPPFIIISGDVDTTTPLDMQERMRDALIAKGGSAELVVLPGVKHGYGYGVTSDAQKKMLVHAERFLKKTFALE
jgi:acetyl esterase/lipase